MEELTGIRLAMGEQPWGPLMHVTDFTHPLTRGLPQDLAWGTNSKLAPIFYVADPQARILGEVVFSQGDCKPGLAVKEFGDWTSVYCSAPNLPAPLLRNLARLAGAHLFSEAGDLLYATPQLLAVHTVAGGPRSFRLNRPVEAVCDLFTDRLLAENVSEFKVELAPFSSVLYYTGEAALLRLLAAPA